MYIKKKVSLSEVIQAFFEDFVQSAAFWTGKGSLSSILRMPCFIIRTFLTPIIIAVSILALLGKIVACPSFLLFKLVKGERFAFAVKYAPYLAIVAILAGVVAACIKFQDKIVPAWNDVCATSSLTVELTLIGGIIVLGVCLLDFLRKNLILFVGLCIACALPFFIKDEKLWYIPVLVFAYSLGTEMYFKDIYKTLSLNPSFVEILYNKLCVWVAKTAAKDREQRGINSGTRIVDVKYANGVFSVYGKNRELLSEISGESLVSLTDYTLTIHNKSDNSTYTYNAHGDII